MNSFPEKPGGRFSGFFVVHRAKPVFSGFVTFFRKKPENRPPGFSRDSGFFYITLYSLEGFPFKCDILR